MSGVGLHAVLVPHSGTPSNVVRSIEVRWARDRGAIELEYVLEADLGSLWWPPPVAAAGRADGLWRTTCFEAFVMPEPGAAYTELNLAPSGEWACYGFTAYRERMHSVALPEPPVIVARLTSLKASVRLSSLADGSPARLALAAVIEERGGRLSYWALQHPSDKPDFHHPDGFALVI